MKNKFTKLLFVLLILVISLSACGAKESSDVKKDIIGKWVSSDEILTLDFTADKKMHSVYSTQNGVSLTTDNNAIWLDDNHLLGTWDANMMAWKVRIWDDEMQLKPAKGQTIKMSRSK